MTADRVLATTAEILRRPTEYFSILRKHRDGRHSTRHYRMEYCNGRHSTNYNRGNTITTDKVLATTAEALSRPTE